MNHKVLLDLFLPLLIYGSFFLIYYSSVVGACLGLSRSMVHLGTDLSSCPPIDSFLKLMTVWRITGKIIGTTIIVSYTHAYNEVLTIFGLAHFFCFVFL